MWEDLAINIVIQVTKQVIKNPKKKGQMRKVLLKLRDAINVAYPDE